LTPVDGRGNQENTGQIVTCVECLKMHIKILQPSIIISLGKTVAISLLGVDSKTPIDDLRGRLHQYENIPLMVTLDPVYLLSHSQEKKKVWSDLCLAMSAIVVH
jgi:uracil-DNA glycosylase